MSSKQTGKETLIFNYLQVFCKPYINFLLEPYTKNTIYPVSQTDLK